MLVETDMNVDRPHLDHVSKLVHLIHTFAAQEPAIWREYTFGFSQYED